MSFSQNLKTLRLKKEMTQEQLANILGVSPQAVSKWETSDTYPDGALLAPLANALDVSLDRLFDNRICSMGDLSTRIRNLISVTPAEQRFHIARDICWQIEKGLFNCQMAIEDQYSPDEIRKKKRSSYILNDYGFTHVSNRTAPFFSVFPEYGNSLSEAISDGEELRKTLAILSSSETMKAILFLHSKEENFVFEGEALESLCGISADSTPAVLTDLSALHLVRKSNVEIDGSTHTLYYSMPSHKVIALLLMAKELMYDDGYCFQAHHRSQPYLK